MKKILVFQHVPHVILGTLNPLLKQAGFRVRYHNFGRDPNADPKVKGYDGLVILGGPMSAYDTDKHPHLVTEMKCIEEALKENMPILGICLGAQLLAKTLGAEVKPNPVPEIGWYGISKTQEGAGDPLLSHLAPEEKIFQWHSDTFDIPESATRLAQSSTCERQAFRYGNHVYGFQFHLEVDRALIGRWLSMPEYTKQLEGHPELQSVDDINAGTDQFIARSEDLSSKVFGAFIQKFGLIKEEKIQFPSR